MGMLRRTGMDGYAFVGQVEVLEQTLAGSNLEKDRRSSGKRLLTMEWTRETMSLLVLAVFIAFKQCVFRSKQCFSRSKLCCRRRTHS